MHGASALAKTLRRSTAHLPGYTFRYSPKERDMDAVVSAEGLTIPKRLLRGMQRVHIRKKQGVITITPQLADDPLLGLGSKPTGQRLARGAKNHDKIIYSGR